MTCTICQVSNTKKFYNFVKEPKNAKYPARNRLMLTAVTKTSAVCRLKSTKHHVSWECLICINSGTVEYQIHLYICRFTMYLFVFTTTDNICTTSYNSYVWQVAIIKLDNLLPMVNWVFIMCGWSLLGSNNCTPKWFHLYLTSFQVLVNQCISILMIGISVHTHPYDWYIRAYSSMWLVYQCILILMIGISGHIHPNDW